MELFKKFNKIYKEIDSNAVDLIGDPRLKKLALIILEEDCAKGELKDISYYDAISSNILYAATTEEMLNLGFLSHSNSGELLYDANLTNGEAPRWLPWSPYVDVFETAPWHKK